MLQAAPQFTPIQLLDAGRRAEAEGNVDAAIQFYRQTADQYAYTPEAAEARGGLARISAGWQPKVWINGSSSPHQPEYGGRKNGSARKAKKLRYAAPRDQYRAARLLARCVSALGWLLAVAGAGVGPAYWLMDRPAMVLSPVGALGSAVGLVIFGLVTVVLGQATRAMFDQASAARELIAIERAKSGAEPV
jgi:hypothetical protein